MREARVECPERAVSTSSQAADLTALGGSTAGSGLRDCGAGTLFATFLSPAPRRAQDTEDILCSRRVF